MFAARGGWGGARLLPFLDWDTIRANPKLLVGFSDVTALHLAFAARAGFPTIHAPNVASSWQTISWESLWRLAFAGDTPVFAPPELSRPGSRFAERWRTAAIRPGKASGRLLGGNLSVLSALVGTPTLAAPGRHPVSGGRGRSRIPHRPDVQPACTGRYPEQGRRRGVRAMQPLQRRRARLYRLHRAGTCSTITSLHSKRAAFRGANIGHEIANQLTSPVGATGGNRCRSREHPRARTRGRMTTIEAMPQRKVEQVGESNQHSQLGRAGLYH